MMTGPYGRNGPLARVLLLAAAAVWWVGSGCGRWSRRGTVVLCYHGVGAGDRERFARQARAICGRAVCVGELMGGGSSGRLPHVCMTFDDAFANLIENVIPITRELDIPVMIFVVTGNLGRPPGWPMPPGHPESGECTMTEAEIVRNTSSQCSFGSHSVTHPSLAATCEEKAVIELRESRAMLERIKGPPVEAFAFPHGSYTSSLLRAAREAGYRYVFTLDADPVGRGAEGVYGRFSASPQMWWAEFVLTAAGAYSWLGWTRRLARSLRRQIRLSIERLQGRPRE